jgi:hypothetical protein
MKPLKKPIRCWNRTTPYDLQEGVQVTAEWNERLQWWDLSFDNAGKTIKATTTESPEV